MKSCWNNSWIELGKRTRDIMELLSVMRWMGCQFVYYHSKCKKKDAKMVCDSFDKFAYDSMINNAQWSGLC